METIVPASHQQECPTSDPLQLETSSASRLKGIAIGLTAAVGMNLVLFLGIPFLTNLDDVKPSEDFGQAVLLAAKKPPPPPTPPERKPEPQKKEKPPEAPPKLTAKPKPKQTPRPRMRVQAPQMDFEVNARLAEGMAVAAPAAAPPPPAPVRAEFELGEVDTNPKPKRRVAPVYPYSAKRQRITGKVVARFLVNSKGEVSRVKIVSSEPQGVFDDSVLAALEKWRFAPGVLDGKPVAVWVSAPFEFSL
jgi:protein TonB